jgi:hypothetical protein
MLGHWALRSKEQFRILEAKGRKNAQFIPFKVENGDYPSPARKIPHPTCRANYFTPT